MTSIVVLGGGLVGRHVALDLASAFDVTLLDRREEDLGKALGATSVCFRAADLSTADAVRAAVAPFDLVVDALPGRLGFQALEATIDAGKDVVDIAFMPEDPLPLGAAAEAKGVTAIIDFGVAPGMSNAILGHHVATMKHVDRFECLVGGLPVERRWPFDYKAPFSPADVLEEYTRPTRYVEHGALVVRPALTDPERLHVEGVGTLESLNTDGLRTLLTTQSVPNMKEKTLRYPGHGRLMEALREAGFLGEEEIAVGNVRVRPRDVSAALLFPLWALSEEEAEFTVMRITVEGESPGGGRERHVWDLLDRGDPKTSSMARTTGFPCAAAVHLIASGRWQQKGVFAPEHIGAEANAFEFVLEYQAERGVRYARRVGMV